MTNTNTNTSVDQSSDKEGLGKTAQILQFPTKKQREIKRVSDILLEKLGETEVSDKVKPLLHDLAYAMHKIRVNLN